MGTVPEAKHSGLYVWTVDTPGGDLVYYVGETGVPFARRMHQHLEQQLAGMYHIHDPDAFARGVRKPLWHGMYGKSREPGGLAEFLRRLPDLAPALQRFVALMRFHLAPVECERRLRCRIEAALARHFYSVPGPVGEFQETNVRYAPRRADEAPVEVSVESDCPLIASPARLSV
jgi:hypothetical protein